MSEARIITCATCNWSGEDACPECHAPHLPRRVFIEHSGGIISYFATDPLIQVFILEKDFIEEGDDLEVLELDTNDGAFLLETPDDIQSNVTVDNCLLRARLYVRKVQDERRTEIRPGSQRLVFDAKAWGGCDVGDNLQFWKKATIIDIHGEGADRAADVRFYDGKVSLGHLVSAMKPVGATPEEKETPHSGWKG